MSAIVVSCIFLFFSIITLIIKKSANNKYFYKFYIDRLEYRNTLFSKKIKTVKYEDFKEIKYYQGFMQSKFNLGEIWILTRNKNIISRRLFFKLIPNVEQEYEKIIKIFNE